ncbi:MAG: squalene/phytoene synthase family protein [Alphaproteobacteria bacterium]|nr:squalene/phytoene synthase family protein [Alphaproteobacteria bacterium]
MNDHGYCAAQVRTLDSDRYVTTLFAPSALRGDLLALYAFNLELARSREAASEPMLGRIRLQWWRDAIAECYAGAARRHQIVQPLGAAIERHNLSRHLFDRIIDAREADFESTPPETVEDLVTYADATSGALNLLALQILGVRDETLEQAAAGIGTAWALAGTVRGLGHLLQVGRLPLPRDLMDKHRLSQAALQSLKPSREVCNVVEEISIKSLNYINKHRVIKSGPAMPALSSSVLARAYLKRLAKTGHDPFNGKNVLPLAFRAWRLMLPAITGRI